MEIYSVSSTFSTLNNEKKLMKLLNNISIKLLKNYIKLNDI